VQQLVKLAREALEPPVLELLVQQASQASVELSVLQEPWVPTKLCKEDEKLHSKHQSTTRVHRQETRIPILTTLDNRPDRQEMMIYGARRKTRGLQMIVLGRILGVLREAAMLVVVMAAAAAEVLVGAISSNSTCNQTCSATFV
jgi:hypothetical protein